MLTSRRPQRTIAREAAVAGVSFLESLDVRLRFRPAEADTGIVFVRADLPDSPSVPARVDHVIPRQRRTTIRRGAATVEMVEHVLAALSGLDIDNCRVEIDGPETPGCDGSSLAFTEALAGAGAVEQDRPRDLLVIDRPITVRDGPSSLTAYPGEDDHRLVLTYNLDYGRQTPIGSQSLFVEVNPESFRDELAPSRTFLLEAEAKALRDAGIGRRATESDLLIFGPDGVIGNTLRYRDECVRHKILDLVGDLALLGKDIAGHVVAHRSGHALNAALVRKFQAALTRQPKPVPPGTPSAMEIGEIMRLLPHRYPFLLVDRVVEIEPGRRIRAIKNVSCNEPFFTGHWPGRPIMPGVLILEALAQAAGLLIAQGVDPSDRSAMIVSIDGVKIRRQVTPGDQLLLEVTEARIKSRSAHAVCRASVDGQVAAEAKIRFVIFENDGRAAVAVGAESEDERPNGR